MAAIGQGDLTTNQTMVSVVRGALERRCGWAEHVGEDVYPSFWVANRAVKN